MKKTKFELVLFTAALAACACLVAACGSVESRGTGHPAPGDDAPPVDASEERVEAVDGKVAAEFIAEPGTIRSDGSVILRVRNQGEVALTYGRPITVERWEESGWVETEESRDAAWTMELLFVSPGSQGVEQRWPFLPGQRPAPGWYRFSKDVRPEGLSGAPERLVLRARVRVED